jgi:hypothetical protein
VRRRLAVWYFLAQASAVVAWWALLAALPAAWPLFALRESPRAVLGAFAPGDVGVVALGSALVAWRHGRAWAGALAWVVAGAMSYAASYTATALLLGVAPPLGACLMVPAAVASVAAAAILSRDAGGSPTDAVPPRAAP